MGNERVAAELAGAVRYLTDVWTTAVRQDDRIHSDDGLDGDDLKDHVPKVVEEIAEIVRTGRIPTPSVLPAGRVHAYVRFRQRYRARDLVRELSLLRLVLLDFLADAARSSRLALTLEEYAEVVRLVALAIDEELRYAVTIYTEADPDR